MSEPYLLDLHPPRDWQVFENFCRDLMKAEWGAFTEIHSRSDQRKEGVDVYALGPDGYVGLQCKKKEPGQELSGEDVREIVEDARGFEPPLTKLIIATTAERHTQPQEAVWKINTGKAPKSKPPFVVELKFWDDLVELLQKHPQAYVRWRRRLAIGSGVQVSTKRLPAPKDTELIGREQELAQLDDAWADPKTHAISLIAVAGAGKTTLVEHWLQRLERDEWRGAEAVFLWSFYSQGSEEGRQASGDLFIAEALKFFGDADPSVGSPRDRGLRLSELVRQRNSLLVLDGLESIQNPAASAAKPGFIKDPAVAALISALVSGQPGLLVLTAREEVSDLQARRGTSAQVIDLGRLDKDAGIHLLSRLGVKGRPEELAAVVEEVHGHPLTLTLLGTYLVTAHRGDVRAWHDLPLVEKAEQIGDSRAARVMAAYADWFGKGPEQQILSLLGLFDRPAEAGALAALRKPPGIPGLTDRLVDRGEPQWNNALDRLRKARLVLEEPGQEKEIDAHPLVREYFGRVLETERPEAYRAGHQRLYEHYAASAPNLPNTLEQMEPLYRAIAHGCRAGRREDVWNEVYVPRVLRGNEFFSTKKLGAFGSDLVALANFFERPWNRPSTELRPEDRAWLLNYAGLCLRALGRLGEAVEPMARGLELAIRREDWKNAARSAGNLSELTLTLCEVSRSVEVARESVGLADRSGDTFQRIVTRTTLADAFHSAGRLDEAEATFREAEVLQAERQPQYPKLYSLEGYRYCELLLSRAAPLDGSGLERLSTEAAGEEARRLCEEVLARAQHALDLGVQTRPLLSIALDHLSLGRARLGLALATEGGFGETAAALDRAVQGLRRAGDEEFVARGLLARAILQRFAGNTAAAQADLAAALEIAERGRMRLHECDAHLEWGRLCWSTGDREGARVHLETARRLVEETSYGRRHQEVAVLSAALEPGGTAGAAVLSRQREAILERAARHGARNVRLFGSAARGKTTLDSDLDFLVDMDPGRSLLDLVSLHQDLEKLLGRKVDVVTERSLSPVLRNRVLEEAIPL